MNATQEANTEAADSAELKFDRIEIRSFVSSDYPEMYAVWAEAELHPFTPEQVTRLLSGGGSALVAVAISASGIRSVVGTLLWSHNGQTAFLWKLAVKRCHRHRGIARLLLRRAEHDIVAAGLDGVGLLTRDTNTAARSLYTREGWKQNAHHQFWGKRLLPDPTKPAHEKEPTQC